MSEETVLQRDLVIHGGGILVKEDKVLSEREILELVKKGDREAYQEIVIRYMQRAYYIALGFVQNPQDAMDLSQESFIRAFRKIKSFNTQMPFFPWFYRLMKNLCIDFLKRRSHHKEVPLEEVHILKEEREDRELREVLWRGIEKLPMEQKEVVILRYFQQMSYQEIAEMTGKPAGTVMSSLFYAKKNLKKIIGRFLGIRE